MSEYRVPKKTHTYTFLLFGWRSEWHILKISNMNDLMYGWLAKKMAGSVTTKDRTENISLCNIFDMFNLPLNATDSCPDGSIMLLFPTITVKHYRISLLLSFLTAARFLTMFYLRTFSFKKHGEALAVDFAILISLLVQNPLHPVNDTCMWWFIFIIQ